MEKSRSSKRVAIIMFLLLAVIVAIIACYKIANRPRPPIPPIPDGYLTEPPIASHRTVLPSGKTPYPSSVTTRDLSRYKNNGR